MITSCPAKGPGGTCDAPLQVTQRVYYDIEVMNDKAISPNAERRLLKPTDLGGDWYIYCSDDHPLVEAADSFDDALEQLDQLEGK